VPYAIDFSIRRRISERRPHHGVYFEHVVEKMARLVIDRALNGKGFASLAALEEMLGVGAAAGFTGAPKEAAVAGQKSAAAPAAGSAQRS